MADTRRGGAAKWWLILITVVGVLGCAWALFVSQVLVAPTAEHQGPVTPSVSSSPTRTPAASQPSDPASPQVIRPAGAPMLPGAGAGDVFVQAATAIYRIELATGRVTKTPTPDLQEHSSFVAGPSWVVFKTIDNVPGVIVHNGQPAKPLPAGLQRNGRLNTAPDGTLWFTPEDATGGIRKVTRVDISGRAVKGETIKLPGEVGTLTSDGTGYLLSTNAGGIYQHQPSETRRLSTGQLIAVGQHHLLVWDCDQQARCGPYRVNRRDAGHHTKLSNDRAPVLKLYQDNMTQASDSSSEMSPDGTHAALRVPGTQADEWPLAVLDLETGRSEQLPGSLTDSNPNTQLAWTPNSRWLLAITDHRMRAFDTVTDTARTIAITDDQLLHLTMTGATGN